MTHVRWIYAGAFGLAGGIALAIAAAPSRPSAGTVSAPAPSVSARPAAPVPAPAPVLTVAPAATRPAASTAGPAASGIVPGSAGMVIAIDPETGEVGMPTPEQLAEMKLTESETVSHDAGGTLVVHPGGMKSLDLEGRSQEYAVIRRAADGRTTIGCGDDPAKAGHVLPAPSGLEEE
jgi:hypothetical protein